MDGPVEAGRAALRRTKLVCTLGPAVDGRVGELVAAGADVARLNFSHGSPAQRASFAAAVRDASKMHGRQVALLADLAGPKIRTGELAGGSVELVAGRPFVLRAAKPDPGSAGDTAQATVGYERLPADVRRGDTILLGDGAVELRVEAVDAADVRTVVVRGGTIRSRTGVAIPSHRLSMPALTDRDRADARIAVHLGSDYVAQSFVRSAEDVMQLRQALGSAALPIIAKIETRPAIDAFDAILDVADGVMVARGDMGVELPYEDVPIVQKQLVSRALERGVPTIVATQMLESMVSAPRPTRAEASDVANAVFDGADAIMLSAETAIGKFPILAAEAAIRIIRRCEAGGEAYLRRPARSGGGPGSGTEGIAIAAIALADADPTVDAIVCFTRSGRTARMLAGLRPTVPIIAFSADESVAARLALVHGVVPRLVPEADGQDPVGFDALARWLAVAGVIAPGSSVVLVVSADVPGTGPTRIELRQLPA